MDLTLFLAAIWGPVMGALGVGMFVSRSYYIKIYRDIERDALAVLVCGIALMGVGIIQVMFHNVWGNALESIVSLLGWGALVKGTVLLVLPKVADRMGDQWVKMKMLPLAGAVMLAIGGYLTWFAYFA